MKVSDEKVAKFLLEVLNQSSFPGHMVEFVAAVKAELAAATVEQPQ